MHGCAAATLHFVLCTLYFALCGARSLTLFFEFPWKLEHTSQVTSTQWLIISLVGFALIVWVFLKFVWPSMVRPHLVDRHRGIVEAARQVESTMSETRQLRDEYQRRLEQIHEETQRRIEE